MAADTNSVCTVPPPLALTPTPLPSLGEELCSDRFCRPASERLGLPHQNHVIEDVNDAVVSLDIRRDRGGILHLKAFRPVNGNRGSF